MRILILSPRFPHALGKADSMTVYRIVKHLSQRHEIYLACFYDKPDDLRHLPELEKIARGIRCIPRKKWKSVLNMGWHFLRGDLPLQTAYYLDGEMREALREMIREHKPDLVYSHLIRTSEYVKEPAPFKRILALQISQTLNYRRMIQHIEGPLYKILYGIEYRRVRRYEPAIMRRFDSCLLISRYDKESLDGHEGLANVFYSPHGVDVDHYTRMENVERENAILFCGVLETPTNLDAAMYFYKQIYPLVKEQVRDVRFYLMGKNPPRAIRRIAEKDPSVIVPGFVKDLRPYYSKARVGIDPLRIGAGLQNKLLISMCMELPMVSTSVANEGIAAEPGRHLLIGDTARDFADAVVELLRNKNKAENIAREARRFVEEKWTWEYHFEALEKHFVELVSGH